MLISITTCQDYVMRFFFLLFLLSISTVANANVLTKEMHYTAGGASLKGYVAFDDAISEKRPGVLIVHEWWGHNEYIRSRARMLAEIGYTAFAVDIYGDGKLANHPKQAGEFMQAAFKNFGATKAKFEKAVEILQKHKTLDSNKIAAIGYCFGGEVLLRLARSGTNLSGVVAFHSALPLEPPISKDKMTTSIFVANGSEDSFLTSDKVAKFAQQMVDANADFTYLNLPGVKHSYTNPKADELSKKFKLPNLKYDKQADEHSWQAMQQFFDYIFSKGKK